ncbi:MAG: hypothetical protein IH608_12270, partial [Proteobacteria bacterium]|nr:hypothetical protein [Pseudomonadota bacterium]
MAYGIARLVLQWGNYDTDALAAGLADTPEALWAALAPYTPEGVEAVSGVPASTLVTLARDFSERSPAVALADHDAPAAPAASLLNHLAGTVNRPGGVATARGPFFLPALRPTASPESWLGRLARGEARPGVYWAVDANPAYDAPETDAVGSALRDPERVGFLVATDTHLTETAALADLFLPRATHF